MKNTKETKAKIMARVEELKRQISMISEQIENDRRENSSDDASILHELLDKKEILENNINSLLESLNGAEMPEHFGKKFQVSVNGMSRLFQIVHPTEADSVQGKISADSPLAQALLGNGSGDVIEVSTPGGAQMFKILSVT